MTCESRRWTTSLAGTRGHHASRAPFRAPHDFVRQERPGMLTQSAGRGGAPASRSWSSARSWPTCPGAPACGTAGTCSPAGQPCQPCAAGAATAAAPARTAPAQARSASARSRADRLLHGDHARMRLPDMGASSARRSAYAGATPPSAFKLVPEHSGGWQLTQHVTSPRMHCTGMYAGSTCQSR